MSSVRCPSCGTHIEVPKQQSATPWVIGCVGAVVAIPVLVAIVGLLAAIAIPSFMKARSTSQMNACVNNMRMIDAATEQWAMENSVAAQAPIDPAGIGAYLPGGTIPICPAQGSYRLPGVGLDPDCSLHGALSDPHAPNYSGP